MRTLKLLWLHALKFVFAVFGAACIVVAIPRPAAAQYLDPDTCWTCRYSREHFAAGAALDAGMQVLPSSWRKGWADAWWKRTLVVAAIGVTYEAGEAAIATDPNVRGADGQPVAGKAGYGFSLMDLGLDIAGALAVEGVVALAKKIF